MPRPCVFCQVVAGTREPGAVIWENEYAAAFPPRNPAQREGYLLVVPRVHVRNLYHLPERLLGPMLGAVRRAARMVESDTGASGTTVRFNNCPPGQEVFHLHFHVVPRFVDDRQSGST